MQWFTQEIAVNFVFFTKKFCLFGFFIYICSVLWASVHHLCCAKQNQI